MAYELVEEVLDHAPEMTAAERLILVCIAEDARNVLDRAAKIPSERLLRRVGGEIGERGIRQALTRLAGRGLDVRVPLGYDRRGAPVYAVPGRVRQFRLPHFRPAAGDCRCYGCREVDRGVFPSSIEAAPQFPLPDAEGEKEEPQCRLAEPQFRLGGTTVPPGGTTVPPTPSIEVPMPLQDPDSSVLALSPGALARAELRAHLRDRGRLRAA